MPNIDAANNRLLIKKAIEYISARLKEQPSIEQLAKHVGMSKYHFIRTFREYVGLTPKQFIHSMMLNRAKTDVKNSKSILESSLEIGLSSPSRLHELFVNIMGVTPKEWRDRGTGVKIVYGEGGTPFGDALVAYTPKGVCYLGFLDLQSRQAVYKKFFELWENAELSRDDAQAKGVLDEIFTQNANKKESNSQINIWKALLNSYIMHSEESEEAILSDLFFAKEADDAPNNENEIKTIIPCYKELIKSGVVGGYAHDATEEESVHFRKADKKDIPKLCELLAVLFSQEEEFAPDEDKQRQALNKIIENDSVGDIYIAEEEGSIVGMVNILYTVSTALGDKVAILEDMVVARACRGRHIGSALLDYAVSQTKEKGCKRVTLLADGDNARAHRFYEQKGFTMSGMVPFRLLF